MRLKYVDALGSHMVEDVGGTWDVMHSRFSWMYSHAEDDERSIGHKDTWCAPRLIFTWWKTQVVLRDVMRRG